MNNNDRDTLIKTSWELHALVERSYLANVAAKNSDQWLEKTGFYWQIWQFIYYKLR